MIKKLVFSTALFGVLLTGGLQLATAASAASSNCEFDCFLAWDECTEYLPWYKCDQIYDSCVRRCGG